MYCMVCIIIVVECYYTVNVSYPSLLGLRSVRITDMFRKLNILENVLLKTLMKGRSNYSCMHVLLLDFGCSVYVT